MFGGGHLTGRFVGHAGTLQAGGGGGPHWLDLGVQRSTGQSVGYGQAIGVAVGHTGQVGGGGGPGAGVGQSVNAKTQGPTIGQPVGGGNVMTPHDFISSGQPKHGGPSMHPSAAGMTANRIANIIFSEINGMRIIANSILIINIILSLNFDIYFIQMATFIWSY